MASSLHVVGTQIAFFLFAAIVVVGSWRVVTGRDVMRSALALVIVLAGMAPLFVLVAADFLAAVQILVYVGAVVVLMLFAIMLTRSPQQPREVAERRSLVGPAVAVSIGLALVVVFAVVDAFGDTPLRVDTAVSTVGVGRVLLGDQVLAFEAVSVLLLAALIGAVVLARREP